MKISKLFGVSLGLLALGIISPMGASAGDAIGGQDSGGGNASGGSTTEQVSRLANKAWGYFSSVMAGAKYQVKSENWSPRSRELIQRIESDLRRFENSKLQLTSGPCEGSDGAEVDASTTLNVPGAKICVSVGRLTRLPPLDLFSQLSALLVHEVSHQYGATEEEAQVLQRELLKNFASINIWDGVGAKKWALSWRVGMLRMDLSELRSLLAETNRGGSANSKSAFQFCMRLTSAQNYNYGIEELLLYEDIAVNPILPENLLLSIHELYRQTTKLLEPGQEACANANVAALDPHAYDAQIEGVRMNWDKISDSISPLK